jgi:hypothetical protein
MMSGILYTEFPGSHSGITSRIRFASRKVAPDHVSRGANSKS